MKDETKNEPTSIDIAVIGGGLAGLTAAVYLARAGRTVTVFEKGPQPGGRASTQTVDGFHFNQGPHALYRGGHGVQVLRELGISYRGAKASYEGSWVMRRGELFPLPKSPEDFATTRIFSEESRPEAIGLLGGLGQVPLTALNAVPLRSWLNTQIQHTDVRSFFEGLLRLSTYANAPDVQSAGAALAQLGVAQEGVDYLDGGWQSLVEALRMAAVSAGAKVETRHLVAGMEMGEDESTVSLSDGSLIRARTVISTVAPSTAAKLVNRGNVASLRKAADSAVPIYAACLDVGLRGLPRPEHQFAVGLDQPWYYSVHSRSAKLGPEGTSLIQVAKYLPADADEKAEGVRAELEGVMDWLQPGWRDVLATKRFLPHMMVSNAVVAAANGGALGRPGPAVPDVPGLFLAGDWVGAHGMLVDASLASAREATKLVDDWLGNRRAELAAA